MTHEPVATEVSLVRVEGLLPGASNATLLAADEAGTLWVYKPQRGEQPLWDFPQGTLARREVATFRVSEAFAFDVVPETRMADGPYGPGSAQLFLTEDFTWDPRSLIVEGADELWPVATLDLIVNNADRKIGHLLREPGTSEIWAIDNGLTFNEAEKLRTVLWGFAGRTIPSEILGRINPERLPPMLRGLLTPAEIEATVRRTVALLEDRTHPGPPADRPAMPWPLW